MHFAHLEFSVRFVDFVSKIKIEMSADGMRISQSEFLSKNNSQLTKSIQSMEDK